METTLDGVKMPTTLFSYESYMKLVKDLEEMNLVTGSLQNTAKLDATKINLVRIKRLDKMYEPSEKIKEVVNNLHTPMIWYVISEGWCGDSAQNLPLINKIAKLSSKIELKILLRDDNPEIMEQYLTNGSASVPKLIARHKDTNEDIFTWGARPKNIQQKVIDYKEEHTLNDKESFLKALHLWYAIDKGAALEDDLMKLLKDL